MSRLHPHHQCLSSSWFSRSRCLLEPEQQHYYIIRLHQIPILRPQRSKSSFLTWEATLESLPLFLYLLVKVSHSNQSAFPSTYFSSFFTYFITSHASCSNQMTRDKQERVLEKVSGINLKKRRIRMRDIRESFSTTGFFFWFFSISFYLQKKFLSAFTKASRGFLFVSSSSFTSFTFCLYFMHSLHANRMGKPPVSSLTECEGNIDSFYESFRMIFLSASLSTTVLIFTIPTTFMQNHSHWIISVNLGKREMMTQRGWDN